MTGLNRKAIKLILIDAKEEWFFMALFVRKEAKEQMREIKEGCEGWGEMEGQ